METTTEKIQNFNVQLATKFSVKSAVIIQLILDNGDPTTLTELFDWMPYLGANEIEAEVRKLVDQKALHQIKSHDLRFYAISEEILDMLEEWGH